MKTVFTDRAPVAHAWAHQTQEHARYRDNWRAEGRRLYSYSTVVGFRIRRPDRDANHIGEPIALLTAETYSVTTTRHMGDAWQATRGMERYAVPSLDSLVREGLGFLADEWEAGRSATLARRIAAAERGDGRGFNHYNAKRARDSVAAWFADNVAAINSDSADDRAGGIATLANILAEMAGFTALQTKAMLDKAERDAAKREAAQAKREHESRIADGRRLESMTDEQFAELFPADGGGDWGAKRRAEYGRQLARIHKASKAAGYTTRTRELWRKVKLYREHAAGHDAREQAARRSAMAAQLRDWRNGEGDAPHSYLFAAFPAIRRRLEAAEAEAAERVRAQREADNRAAFDRWQAGDGKRPSEYGFEDGSPEKAAIIADMDSKRSAFLESFDRWQAGDGERPAQLPREDNRFVGNGSPGYADWSRASMARQAIETTEQKERIEREAAERREREAKRFAENTERRRAWLAGESNNYRDVDGRPLNDSEGNALMRVTADGEELETSWGATVPLAHAVKAFRFVKAMRESGRTWNRNGKTIRVGHYQIDAIRPDGSFSAGCHEFSWAEIERVARAAGVLDSPASEEAATRSH